MLHRLSAAAAVVVFFAAASVHAGYPKTQDFRLPTAEEKAMTGVDSSPGAAAAILDWVRIDDDTASYSSDYKRIKVFSEDGKKYGDIEITYMPGFPIYGRITSIDARTIRPDGTIVPFTGRIYEKVVVKVGRQALKAKTFSLPDVQPGSIIEYRFTRHWSDAMLFNTNWSVQHEIPLLRAKLTIKPYDYGDYVSFFTFLGLPPGKKPVRVENRFELDLENVAPYVEESYAPPEQLLKAYVNFYYTSSRLSAAEFWKAEPKNISKRIEDFLGKAGEAKAAAQRLAGADPHATAKNIYAHVQTFRNYSFELEKTEQEMKKESITSARNVNDVLKKSAGSQEEINRAFVAIARAAGLKADAVRVAPRDAFFFSDKLADPEQMSGEIAVITIGDSMLFLDPGTPHAPFGTLSWEKTNVPGIRVSKGTDPLWVMTPQATPEAAMTKRTADLKIDGETLTGKVVVSYTGQSALSRRLRVLADDETERTKDFEDEAKRWFADGASVKLANLTGATKFDEPLVATYDVTLPNLVSAAGSRTVVPVSVFAANRKNPFAPTTRTHAIYYPYPHTEEDEVTLRVPETLKVSALPPPSNLNAGSLGYTSEVTADAQSVTLKRKMFINVMLIDAKNYNPLRTFYSTVLTADQKPLVLVNKE
jgi:hypothetical protein